MKRLSGCPACDMLVSHGEQMPFCAVPMVGKGKPEGESEK
jgi:hypothetical protein